MCIKKGYLCIENGAFYAVVLTKLVPNSTTRKCNSNINFSNFAAKLAPNLMHILHPCRILMQIRCQKAGT